MDPEALSKEVGAAIKSRRKRLKMTQEKLAGHVAMSRASLANIETGRQGILLHHLYRLAEALGVDVTELLPATLLPRAQPDWKGLPLPGNLPAGQKAQIARLVLGAALEIPQPEEKHDKSPESRPGKKGARRS